MIAHDPDYDEALDDFGRRAVELARRIFEMLDMDEVFYSDYEGVAEWLKYYDYS